MRLSMNVAAVLILPLLLAAAFLLGADSSGTQAARLAGAIFTTTPDGGIVNENVRYEDKRDVYLDGGPPPNAPAQAAGLEDGFYVFQITDPPGKILLSRDPSRCRVVRVAGGVIVERVPPTAVPGLGASTDNWADSGKYAGEPCHIDDDPAHPTDPAVRGASGRHDTNVDMDHGDDAGAIVVQMMPYGTTPNPGGVYKAWVVPIGRYDDNRGDLDNVPRKLGRGQQKPHECPDFCASSDRGFGRARDQIKTDNFKVKEFEPPMIHVRKFHDLNANGVRDAGEPEIGVDQCIDGSGNIADCNGGGGWPIWITDPTTVTNHHFTPAWILAEPAGTWMVEEGTFSGWTQSAAFLDGAALGAVNPVNVPVAGNSGESHDVLFGNFMPAEIHGEKFIDLDADGVRDAGEGCNLNPDPWGNNAGCQGITIHLSGTDGMGGTVHSHTTTNANGEYWFVNLKPGSYTVCEEVPAEFVQSFPASGADCSGHPAAAGGVVGSIGYNVNLQSGDVVNNRDFGNFSLAEVHGIKFFDQNGNGTQDGNEAGIPDVEIHLDGTDGMGAAVNLVTFTCGGTQAPDCMGEPDGTYWFVDLKPGDYDVSEVVPNGFAQTFPVNPAFHDALLISDQVCDNKDFGNFGPCDGLTPGYWVNWENHYTEAQFLSLLVGTIAEGDADLATFYMTSQGCDAGDAVHCMRRFLMANQLTLNLTQSEDPNLFKPAGAGLVGLCSIQGVGTLQQAIDDALAILANPGNFTREQILDAKNALAAFAEL